MYLTIKETAEYLTLSEAYVEQLVREKKIRTVFDGQQHLINKDQFNTHMEQMEKYKEWAESHDRVVRIFPRNASSLHNEIIVISVNLHL